MPVWRVAVEDGQPTQAPCMRICTILSGVKATYSISPPSAWTAGRMSSITLRMRSERESAWPAGADEAREADVEMWWSWVTRQSGRGEQW